MQRPPLSDTSSLERKLIADSTRSGEGRSSRGSTEHVHDVFLIFLFRDAEELLDAVSRSKIWIPILSENCASSKWCLFRDVSFLKGWESKEIANGDQGEFVGIVVELVLSEPRQDFRVDVPETLVEIDEIIRLLDSTPNNWYFRHGWHWQELMFRSFILNIQETMNVLLDDVDDKSGSTIIVTSGYEAVLDQGGDWIKL